MAPDREQSGPKRNLADVIKHPLVRKAPVILFVASFIFIGFVGGTMIMYAQVAPSGYFQNAYRAGMALFEKHTRYHDPLGTDLWGPTRNTGRGVTRYDPDQTWAGLTLYTSGHACEAYLIDFQGRIAHKWERPYSTVWDASAAVRQPVPDERTNISKAHLLPNGDLLGIYIGVGDSPYGYGMVKLDRASRLIWKNLDNFHHDFAIGPEGLIYALTHSFRQVPAEGVDHLILPIWEDFLAIVSPEGRTLRKISLLDAVNRSNFRRLLWMVPSFSLADPLHTNNVDYIDAESAAAVKEKIPVAAAGQILLSFRELAGGAIALLDVDSETIVWAMRGSWISQHDPDLLPNGNILLFDNRGHFGEGESRIIEVDPANGTHVWEYSGQPQIPLHSRIRSDQQWLPNGNVLITESDGGRLLEVTRTGEIVWEFINPVRADRNNQQLTPVVHWAQRIDPQDLDPEFLEVLKENSAIDDKGN